MSAEDPSFIVRHADQLPFLMSIVSGAPRVQISMQRVIEAAVIGGVLAGIGYIAVIPRIEERMTIEFQTVRRDLERVERKVDSVSGRVDQDYRELSGRIDRAVRTR